MVGGINFKSMLSNGSGVWIRVREINYLIDKGIITVDKDALKEYVDQRDPEYEALMQNNSDEDRARDLLGRELTETDLMMLRAARS